MSAVSYPAAPRPAQQSQDQISPRLNDLTIRVGTVNGSGSQSANLVLLRALHRMGIPCSGKNLFPSNIEGLPTWFHIRASGQGYIGHNTHTQVLVCMNAQTAADDVRQLPPGAICIHRHDLEVASLRTDVTFYAVPFQNLVEQAYPKDLKDPKYRDKLRKVINMVYVGVVAQVCGIELQEVEAAIRQEFSGRKAKAGAINIQAARSGFAWAAANLPQDHPYRVQRMDATRGQLLIEGNKASALGAVFGGASVLTWYPITPSSSLAEYAEEYLARYRVNPDGTRTYAVVQAEDEIGAIGMAVGAGWAGARAITATSGPGISLMTEFVGLAYFAEIPAVIVDVQRMGPSTGLPTRTCQGDVLKLYLLGHGDVKHLVLLPASVGECYQFTIDALDLAQRFQTPVFVASDLDLGMNLWLTDPFAYPAAPLQRGKLLSAQDLDRLGGFARYKDVDGDGIPYRTVPGTEHPAAAYFTRGTGHNENSGYSERPEDWQRNMDRLSRKHETARLEVPSPIIEQQAAAEVGLIAYGSTYWALTEARDMLDDRGLPTSYCRLRALPVPRSLRDYLARHDRLYVIEQNRDGQVRQLLCSEFPELAPRLRSVRHYNGIPIDAVSIVRSILNQEGR